MEAAVLHVRLFWSKDQNLSSDRFQPGPELLLVRAEIVRHVAYIALHCIVAFGVDQEEGKWTSELTDIHQTQNAMMQMFS